MGYILPRSIIERRQSGLALNVKLCVLCLASCILCFGCGSNPEEGERTSTSEEDIQSGWEEYRSGNHGTAILAFERALTEERDPKYDAIAKVQKTLLADAYNGLGWVYLGFSRSAGVNQKNIAMSLGKFQEAIARDNTNADAWVGQAALLLIRRSSQDDLRNTLKAVDNALQGDAAYLYRHDYDSEADLHALKAQCYYYLGELDDAQGEVKRALAIEKNNNAALVLRKLLQMDQ
jgi:tetratricopeptide (TPR) repeat protein